MAKDSVQGISIGNSSKLNIQSVSAGTATTDGGSIFVAPNKIVNQTTDATGTTIERTTMGLNESNEQLQTNNIEILKIYLEDAKKVFQSVKDKRGYSEKVGNLFADMLGSENSTESLENTINQFESKIKRLEDAQAGELTNPTTGEKVTYEQAYQEAFGKDFNKDDTINLVNAQKAYKDAKPHQEDYYEFNGKLFQFIETYDGNKGKLNDNSNLTELETTMKSLLGENDFAKLYKDKGVNPENMSAQEKYDFLISSSKELVSSKVNTAIEHRQGKTLIELEGDYDIAYTSALGFGNDLTDKINKYKTYQQTAGNRVKSVIDAGAAFGTGGISYVASPVVNAIDSLTKKDTPTISSLGKNAWNDINPLSPLSSLASVLGITKDSPTFKSCEYTLSPHMEIYDKNRGN